MVISFIAHVEMIDWTKESTTQFDPAALSACFRSHHVSSVWVDAVEVEGVEEVEVEVSYFSRFLVFLVQIQTWCGGGNGWWAGGQAVMTHKTDSHCLSLWSPSIFLFLCFLFFSFQWLRVRLGIFMTNRNSSKIQSKQVCLIQLVSKDIVALILSPWKKLLSLCKCMFHMYIWFSYIWRVCAAIVFDLSSLCLCFFLFLIKKIIMLNSNFLPGSRCQESGFWCCVHGFPFYFVFCPPFFYFYFLDFLL